MQKTLRFLANGLAISEIIVVLLPLTLGFLLLIYFALQTLGSIILGNQIIPSMEIALMYFVIAIIETLAGYGLFSLWWLVFNFTKISIMQIPKSIVYGLIAGVVMNLILVFLFALGLISPFGKLPPNYLPFFIYYAGPMLITFTLTSLMWMKNRYGWN